MVNAHVCIGGGGPSPAVPKPEEVPAPAAAATAEVPNGGAFPLKLPKPSQLEKKVLLCCWVGLDDKAPCWAGATKSNTS